jgi:hypothetical protein
MRLKYPFDKMAIGAMITFPAEKAMPVRQAMHNYGNRHNMYFRSRSKCKGGDVVIVRVA